MDASTDTSQSPKPFDLHGEWYSIPEMQYRVDRLITLFSWWRERQTWLAEQASEKKRHQQIDAIRKRRRDEERQRERRIEAEELRRSRKEYRLEHDFDKTLFGERIEPPKAAHVEKFDVEDGLQPNERVVIAAEMIERAYATWPEWDQRLEKIEIEAKRFANCGTAAIGFTCSDCRTNYGVHVTCKSRICEPCGWRYVKQLEKSIEGQLRRLVAKKRRGYVLALLTLTVTSKRYGDKLPDREGILRLYRETSEFLRLHYGRYQAKRTKTAKLRENRRKDVGAGWIAVLETGSDNNNAHCHALVYGPIRHGLRTSWEAITGDSFGVDIREVKPTGEGLHRAVRYITKYIAKPPRTDSYGRLADYAVMIKGSRRLRTGGVFYNRFKLPKRKKCDFRCLVCGGKLLPDGDIDMNDPAVSNNRTLYHKAYRALLDGKSFPDSSESIN